MESSVARLAVTLDASSSLLFADRAGLGTKTRKESQLRSILATFDASLLPSSTRQKPSEERELGGVEWKDSVLTSFHRLFGTLSIPSIGSM